MLKVQDAKRSPAKIKVLGIGGAGNNAINTMIDAIEGGVDFIAANTDFQALDTNTAELQIRLGESGLGAGGVPQRGAESAESSAPEIREFLEGADMVFIAAGMGGGTGTGGAPVVARIAKDVGALTVAGVTKPFHFEGKRRREQAEQGIADLRRAVDTLITIPNQRLLDLGAKNLTMKDALRRADATLVDAVCGITDLIHKPGIINLDFQDVRSVMSAGGLAIMGTGCASGDNRAAEATKMAISSPLLEDLDIRDATSVLINLSGGENLTLYDFNEAASLLHDEAHDGVDVFVGTVLDANLGDEVRVTVIATGFDHRLRSEVDTPDAEPLRGRPTTGRSLRPLARAADRPDQSGAEPRVAAAQRAVGASDDLPEAGPGHDAESYGDEDSPIREAGTSRGEPGLSSEERVWSVPTFLRRQKE